MNINLATAIFLLGVGQLSVLIASALVPMRLNWKATLAPLPPLIRQLFWIYGGYVVLSIVGLGLVCLFNAQELASGSRLARSLCLYGATFWGIRLSLQPFLNVKPYLTSWWLHCGYHLLTLLFTSFTSIYLWAAIR
ncbi:MAG: hypothetical protein C0478_09300 [Planctomyces sp.]|nr:hypothetical protein [Planctomyces sp.]